MSRLVLGLVVFGLLLPTARAQDTAPEGGGPEGCVRLVREPGGHAALPWALAFTPDGKKLVSVGDDRTVQVWDVASGERLGVIRPPTGVDGQGGPVQHDVGTQLVMDPKGQRVAFCVAAKNAVGSAVKTIFVCSLATGQAQVLRHSGPRAFAPDGKSLAVGEGHDVVLVDIATDTPQLKATLLPANAKNAVGNLAYSPDGKTLAVIASDARVFLLDADTLKRRATRTVPGDGHNLRSVSWADDNTLVFRSFARDKGLVVLDANSGELKHSYPKAKLLEPLPDDPSPEGAKPDVVELHALAGTTKAFVRTYTKLRGGHRVDLCYLFDWASGEANKGFSQESPFGCTASAVAPDLSAGAQGDGEANMVLLWNPANGQPLREGERPRVLRPAVLGAYGMYNSVRWRPDGKAVVWERLDRRGSFEELDLTTLTLAPRYTRDLQRYDKENARLTVGDEDRPKSDRDSHLAERGILRKAGSLGLEDRLKGPVVLKASEALPLKGCRGSCRWDLTFVEGDRVVTHAWGKTMLQVFDAATGRLLDEKNPTQSYIQALAVSPRPKGRYLLLGSADQTLTIFNVATSQVLLTVFPTGADWIVWTPQGYYAATPGAERLMGWQVENGPDRLASFYPAERFRSHLYRPDVIKLVLEKGSVKEALIAANVALPRAERPATDAPAEVEKMLPPTATLKLVSSGGNGVVRLATTVEAGAGARPAKSLRLMVDGRPAPGEGFVRSLDRGAAATVNWPDLELPPGKHRVVVLVRGEDASSVSNALVIDTRPLSERPTLHVLAIGVSRYKDKDLDLGSADADARLTADTFAKTCKGEVFCRVVPHVLVNEQATREAIVAAIGKVRRGPDDKAKANDLVIVFFAGHGAKEKDQFYLLPHDAAVDNLATTAISGAALRDELKEMPCQVLLLMDACHAAGFGEKGKLAKQHLKPATDEATRELTDDDVGIAVMCAAMGYETAAEGGTHGRFTEALVAALTATHDVPYNRANHRQYVHHLQSYVFDRVVVESDEKQHPFLHLPWVMESFPLREVIEK
jgi:WD40 repeat protein